MVYRPSVFRILLLLFLLFAQASGSLAAENEQAGTDWEKPAWDRDLALQAVLQVDTRRIAADTFELAKSASGPATVKALKDLAQQPDWPEPAIDAAIYRFTNHLRELPPFSVDPVVLDFLLGYRNRALVAHEEHASMGVPLYPVRAAARGLLNDWTRQQAALDAAGLIATGPDQLLALYAETRDPNIRAGMESAIGAANRDTLPALLEAALAMLSSAPEITGLAGRAAIESEDLAALSEVFVRGGGAALVELSRQAHQRFPKAELDQMIRAIADRAPAATAAMLTAGSGKVGNDKRSDGPTILHSGTGPVSRPEADEGTIEAWTEEDGVLGLGYPVPIPVDTPLPFDGFRSYDGLHARHQELAETSGIVHGHIVGTTHSGREIWAYQIGDADRVRRDGQAEPAMLTNGGIHAREWQTPEVVTGIMELFAEKRGDRHFHDYLLENVNIVLLPVQNVDGFMQTQRFPTQNWLRSDPFDIQNDPQPSPRDGRMRRKNMPAVDEVLATYDDHLLGIDLNRNNPPWWATNPNRSSSDERSLVHHGMAPHSEPEAQALVAAADLGPRSQLRAFTDVHSFSQVFYFHRTANRRLSNNTIDVLQTMSDHNAALPNGSLYLFDANPEQGIDQGFGMTNEWFTTSLGIPAWGVEVEPSAGQTFFPHNPPGCGADYGGLARNCHDGFILPESQIRRVREELARSFAAVYYRQSGPPSIAAVRMVDVPTGAVIFEAEWDPAGENQRTLYLNQLQPLELGRDYAVWIAYDRPMRWREQGEIVTFPGQSAFTLNFSASASVGDQALTMIENNARWVNTPGGAPGGYFRYRDDSFAAEFSFPRDGTNLSLVPEAATATLHNVTRNMTGQALDTNPATVVSWAAGGWAGYEDSNGMNTDRGGTDKTIQFAISSEAQPVPFVVEPGTSAAWYDPAHDGEGFLIEILADKRAVMYWFTFDEDGEQAWYLAAGEVRGNRLIFPELVQTSGGVFGPNFDPDDVTRTVVGSASFLYESCSSGTLVYQLPGRKGRFELQRLTRVMGANCGPYLGPPIREEATESGSWYNPEQDGHGFVIEVMTEGQVLVYWFAYDLAGNQAWFLGVGEIEQGDLVVSEVYQTRGPVFGPEFDPADLELIPWGSLRFDLNCNAGRVTYDGSIAGYGAGEIELQRLSSLDGLECAD
ncbi:MAG: hypothetical protein HKN57_09370 [Xanthomonadales bacterium]|nr:hypothetical protein [Gammaproteobacteria bacterium]NND57451.1 hypothetical protein [Xanthomonadales bacterium]